MPRVNGSTLSMMSPAKVPVACVQDGALCTSDTSSRFGTWNRMDTFGLSGTLNHQHTAAHKVIVTHDLSPTTLSVVREVKYIVLIIGVTIASVVTIRMLNNRSSQK